MGNRPGCRIIWGVPLKDSDWKDGETVRPEWLALADDPGSAEDGFEEVFYSKLPGAVDSHSFYYCGDYDDKTTFIGVALWEAEWHGESPALAPTDEQRAAVAAFLAIVGLERPPAVHALLSYG